MRQRRAENFRFCIFPGYHWCGPGCSGPNAPVNDLDAACKAHDDCYRMGRNKCACDQEFLRRLRLKMVSPSQKGRQARLLYEYMKVQTFFTCGF